MKTWKAAVESVLVLVVLALAILACGETTTNSGSTPTASQPQTHAPQQAPTATAKPSPTAPATPVKPKSWVTVQTFSGDQNTKTPSFQLNDGARIVWSARPADQFGGAFSVTSYTSDGAYDDLIANTTVNKAESGTYTVHGSNKVYLDISGFGVNYSIQVQQYQ